MYGSYSDKIIRFNFENGTQTDIETIRPSSYHGQVSESENDEILVYSGWRQI